MQLPQINSGHVISSGVLKKVAYRIEDDAKMFASMTDRLYENKIGAVVREISFNASDSHAEAGKADEPFQIHLPTYKEPYFSVIDQGLGMDEETAERIFTVLGRSTKNGENIAVGAFGVGSKSPFSYVNAFTVVTTKDGIRNVYNNIKNDEGKPELHAMAEPELVEEPNGVTVTVPVEPKDFDTFASECSRQLRWMKVKPDFIGKTVEFQNPMSRVEETIDDTTFIRRSGGIEVVQGGVAYPVNVDLLLKAMEESRTPRPDTLRNFLNNAIQQFNPAFIFETGQIQVAMSREAVSYDQVTAGRILDRLEHVHDILLKRIYEKMESVDTVWAKTMMLRNNMFLAAKLFKLDENEWGVKVANNDAIINFPKKMRDEFNTGNGKVRHKVTQYWTRRTRKGNYRLKQEPKPLHIVPNDNVLIVFDDGAGAVESRIREYYNSHSNASVFFFHAEMAPLISARLTERMEDGAPVWKELFGTWTRCDIDPMTFARIMDKVEGAPIKFLSELPRPTRQYGGRATRDPNAPRPKYTPAKAYIFEGFTYDYHLDTFKNWEKTFVAPKKMNEDCAYVEIDRHDITMGLKDGQHEWFKLLWRNKEFPFPVYALRAKDIPKIKGNANWRPLTDVLESLLAEKKEHYGKIYVRAAIEKSAGDGFKEFVEEATTQFLVERRHEIIDPDFVRVLSMIHKKNAKRRRYQVNPVCLELYGPQIHEITVARRRKDAVAQNVILERYPLIGFLSNTYDLNDVVRQDIIHMVNGKYTRISETAGQVSGEVI